MDEFEFERLQFETLKNLGLFDEPLPIKPGVDSAAELCQTQRHNSDDGFCNTSHNYQREGSKVYLCDTQKTGQFQDKFVQNFQDEHDGVDDEESRGIDIPKLCNGGYRSPTAASPQDGYSSPTDYDNNASVSCYRSPYKTASAMVSQRHRSQEYTSPTGSPVLQRRKPSESHINEHLQTLTMTVESDDEDLYGAGLPDVTDGLKPFPIGSSGLPVNWSHYCILNSDTTSLEIHQGDMDYDTVYQIITSVDINVKTIERVENKFLLDKFQLEIEHLKRKNNFTEEGLNIVYLFHGTCADKDTIKSESLDQRLSKSGHFGKGIYFSNDPRKCMEYINRMNKGSGYIIMCRVILGKTKIYKDGMTDNHLQREPMIEGSNSRYDSVKGCVSKYEEFVIYENTRALSEYIITVVPECKPSFSEFKIAETQGFDEPVARQQSSKIGDKEFESTDPSVLAVLDSQMMEFLRISNCEDTAKARQLLINSNMDVYEAVLQYYNMD